MSGGFCGRLGHRMYHPFFARRHKFPPHILAGLRGLEESVPKVWSRIEGHSGVESPMLVFCCCIVVLGGLLVPTVQHHEIWRRPPSTSSSLKPPSSLSKVKPPWTFDPSSLPPPDPSNTIERGAFEGVSLQQAAPSLLPGTTSYWMHTVAGSVEERHPSQSREGRKTPIHVLESLCLIYAAFFDMEPLKHTWNSRHPGVQHFGFMF